MGAQREAEGHPSPTQQLRIFYVHRFFANRYRREPRENFEHVEKARKAVQRTLAVEIGYDDIKRCVVFLAKKGILESMSVGDRDTKLYRISPEGLDAYQKSAPLLSQVLYTLPGD